MLDKQNKLVWFSAGGTSAIAGKLAIQKYGKDNVDVWYIHIDSAHKDNKRFIADCEKWYGVEIHTTQSKKYADQFEVIRERRFINGPKGALCTFELKKSVRLQLQRHYIGNGQVFGFEFKLKEINRAIRFKQQYPDTFPEFPLIEAGLTKENCLQLLTANGIEIPKMYQLGYSNNNCIGCTKGGAGYWNKIRVDFPEIFEEMAYEERQIGRSCIKGKFLDTLKPNAGRKVKMIIPDCGDFCEIKFADVITDEALKIFESKKTIDLQSILI